MSEPRPSSTIKHIAWKTLKPGEKHIMTDAQIKKWAEEARQYYLDHKEEIDRLDSHSASPPKTDNPS